MTAVDHKAFVAEIKRHASQGAIPDVARFFRSDPDGCSDDNRILGVRIPEVFPLAKRYTAMSVTSVERLLESPYYEVRLGAVSIMDFQAREKRVTAEHRKVLFDLYIRRHDRINNWDLVDRAAPHVVGGYLADRSRDVLYDLAHSRNPWERRTAIVSTYFFTRTGDVEDTFQIADVLAGDDHPMIHTAVGSWIREAGKHDRKRLEVFLGAHSHRMARPMLRAAVAKLPASTRAKFLK